MAFDSRPGTYGARQPGGEMRWINKITKLLVRRNGGKFAGIPTLLLSTIGRKTGQERVTPVNWFPGAEGSWIIVASAAGGPADPAWYHNLAAAPERVRIEVQGRIVDVRAEQLAGAEREAAWATVTAAAPLFAKYESKTDREIPVIRLTPR